MYHRSKHGFPPRRGCPSKSSVGTAGTGRWSLPLLHVPAVAAPYFSTTHWKVAGDANCSLSPLHRWCSRPADGHLVDCCWEGVPLAGVVVANQCLCQLETEGLHTLSAPAPSWPAPPCQDKGIRDAAIHEEPEDVPVVRKLHSHLCMTEIMYLCIHELVPFLFTAF